MPETQSSMSSKSSVRKTFVLSHPADGGGGGGCYRVWVIRALVPSNLLLSICLLLDSSACSWLASSPPEWVSGNSDAGERESGEQVFFLHVT